MGCATPPFWGNASSGSGIGIGNKNNSLSGPHRTYKISKRIKCTYCMRCSSVFPCVCRCVFLFPCVSGSVAAWKGVRVCVAYSQRPAKRKSMRPSEGATENNSGQNKAQPKGNSHKNQEVLGLKQQEPVVNNKKVSDALNFFGKYEHEAKSEQLIRF